MQSLVHKHSHGQILPVYVIQFSGFIQKYISCCFLLSVVIGRSNRQTTVQQGVLVLFCSLLFREWVLESSTGSKIEANYCFLFLSCCILVKKKESAWNWFCKIKTFTGLITSTEAWSGGCCVNLQCRASCKHFALYSLNHFHLLQEFFYFFSLMVL